MGGKRKKRWSHTLGWRYMGKDGTRQVFEDKDGVRWIEAKRGRYDVEVQFRMKGLAPKRYRRQGRTTH